MVETRDGYVVDLAYSAQAFSELSPLSIGLMAEMSGHAAPDLSAPRYLELGFGQGVTLNTVAAANPGDFEGVDFIPDHVAHAGGLAQASGAKLKLHEEGFADFAKRKGPAFDVIALHGVWSWVDDAARAAIARIIEQRLKPGGLALISYNTPAGWAAIDPMRIMFRRFAAVAEGDTPERMKGAVAFADRLRASGAAFFAQNPVAGAQLDRMKNESPRYLAHEYLNEGYRTSSFAETAADLGAAGLSYLGPARAGEFLDRRRIGGEAAKFIAGIEDPLLAELAREFALNQRFRSDIYVKGAPQPAAEGALAARRFVLTGFTGQAPRVDASGNAAFQRLTARVFEVLSENDAAPRSYAEIDAACPNATFEQIGWALMALIAAGAAGPAHDDDTRAAVAPTTQALNAAIAARAEASGEIQVLACPATGAAIPVRGVAQMYLHLRATGAEDPPAGAWAALKTMGEAMTQDGRRLEGDGANLDALRRDYDWFSETGLRRLQRLGVIAG